jgi:hypothetical protein
LPLSGIPGGSPVFFEVEVRDSAFPDANASLLGGSYAGFSSIFTAVPSTGILYNSLVNHGSPSFSTWADGTFDMSAQYGLTGAVGAIEVGTFECIPEPSALTIFVLAGTASLVVWRCRAGWLGFRRRRD